MTGLEIAGIVSAAASAAAAGGNAISQGQMNKKNRAWQEKMFKKQNAEWNRRQNFMNEYNSPPRSGLVLQKQVFLPPSSMVAELQGLKVRLYLLRRGLLPKISWPLT